MLVALTLGTALTPLAIGPAAAQCVSETFLQIDVPGVATFYYDDRGNQYPYPGQQIVPYSYTYIYEEANAQAGLQRGGSQWLLSMAGAGHLDMDFCRESASPDRLWY